MTINENPLKIGHLYRITKRISLRLPKNPNTDTLVFTPKLPFINGDGKIIMPLDKDIKCSWITSNGKENCLCMKLLANDKIFYFLPEPDFFNMNPDIFELIEV